MGNKLKDPPEFIIKAGYNMTKARLNWWDLDEDKDYYLETAIKLMRRAITWMEKNEGMFQIEAGETMYYLMEAAHARTMMKTGASHDSYRKEQGLWAIARAHKAARDVLQKYGYRDITNEDFAKHGDGGGR